MKQTRAMSAVEACINVVIGFWVAIGAQMVVFPLVGMNPTFETNLRIGAIMTLVSLVRSYMLRRVFEAIRVAMNGIRFREPCRELVVGDLFVVQRTDF